jgi:DMSO/TMAO reductase YedYZ heme-binding membrane subunit
MKLGIPTLVAIGAIAVLVALAVTDQVLPATGPRAAQVRPWLAARALGLVAYLLLAAQVGLGLLLSHPRNPAAWRLTKQVFPWHQLLTVFAGAFLVLHVVLLAVDPYARVGVLGALVPGFSQYRPPAVAVGSVALYALILTAVTATWTRLLPTAWWLRIHRVAAAAFLLAWGHAVLAGTDGGVLLPLYLVTGFAILAGIAHRWWTARAPQLRLVPAGTGVVPEPSAVPRSAAIPREVTR